MRQAECLLQTCLETNEMAVEYKVVRLEGDLDITNLSTPFVQLRIKMDLTNGGFTTTNVIYNAITDLSDKSDTVVIDFLTDYKAARVKNLVKMGETSFAKASARANKELASALSLVKDPSKLEAFEHYLPGSEGVELTEYFNSIVWVMALIDQSSKVPNFNRIYNEYRQVFAEEGDFNKAIETTYAGKKQSMFFVDYLALLINAHFFKWYCALDANGDVRTEMLYNGECETDDYRGHDEIYYKILQNGFVNAYGLDSTKALEFDQYSKIQKSNAEGGHFRYFEYYRINKIWYPVNNLDQIAFAEKGKCDATAVSEKKLAVVTIDNADYSMLCQCERGMCGYGMVDPCLGRDEGYEGFSYFGNSDVSAYKCKNVCRDADGNLTEAQSGEGVVCSIESYELSSPSPEEVVPDGKTVDEILNPVEGEGLLGKCAEANKDEVTAFDEKGAERSTTTGFVDYICNGVKWVKASPVDLYCVGDHVEATEQKITDENLAELGLKYDQKCEFYDELYVRNSEEPGSEWIDATGYIRKVCENLVVDMKIKDSVYVFMNGYKENAVYMCIEGVCEKLSSDEAITNAVDQFREKHGKISFTSTDSLSVFCNKAKYEKATGYVDGIAYEVELGNAEDKTKYVASANRKDWHEVGVSDLYGECSESVMKNSEANWVTVGGKKYACDCDQNGDKLECDWRKGTATETALDKPCTKNIADAETVTLFNGPNSKVYLCKYTPIPDNLGAHDLVEATVIDAFGECNDAKMKAQTKLSMFGETAYKCDCITAAGEYDCEWSLASANDVEYGLCTMHIAGDDASVDWEPSFAADGNLICKSSNGAGYEWLEPNEEEKKQYGFWWCSENDGWRFLNGATTVLKNGDPAPGKEENGAYAICDNVPDDITTYMLTYWVSGSSNFEKHTADDYFDVDCESESTILIPNSNSSTYTADGKLVHDFVCSDGNLVIV